MYLEEAEAAIPFLELGCHDLWKGRGEPPNSEVVKPSLEIERRCRKEVKRSEYAVDIVNQAMMEASSGHRTASTSLEIQESQRFRSEVRTRRKREERESHGEPSGRITRGNGVYSLLKCALVDRALGREDRSTIGGEEDLEWNGRRCSAFQGNNLLKKEEMRNEKVSSISFGLHFGE